MGTDLLGRESSVPAKVRAHVMARIPELITNQQWWQGWIKIVCQIFIIIQFNLLLQLTYASASVRLSPKIHGIDGEKSGRFEFY